MKARHVVLGCLAVAAIATLCAGGAIWYFLIHEKPQLSSELDVAPEMTLNEPVDLVITTWNPHSTRVELDSIDIDLSLLDAFQVLEIDPTPSQTFEIPLLNQRSWSFGLPVAPEEGVTVTFRLNPIEVGHFSGNVDVCNPHQDLTSHFVDVVVRGGPEAEEP